MTEKFEFTDSIKRNLYIMIGCGLAGLAWAFLGSPENHHSRFWSNILINAYYFTGIGLFGMFVVAATQLAYGGWQVLIRRVLLSMPGFIFIGAALITLVMVGAHLDLHNLYHHWTHPHAGDTIVGDKQGYLNLPFWSIRLLIYLALWLVFTIWMPRFYAEKNLFEISNYKFSKILSAMYLVVFATTESFVSWDLIMSIDPHWYSTLFGWYNFASYGCAAWAFAILLVITLKSWGYLSLVNENHIHDLGKFLFGFSIFWTYLWFSQFMLQWYGNIPEDTKFWVKRFDVGYFKFTIFFALILNFLMPLLILISRGAKRNFKTLGFMACVVIFGHYVDFFNYVFFEPNVNAAASAQHHAAASAAHTALYAQNTDHEADETAPATTDAAPADHTATPATTAAAPAAHDGHSAHAEESHGHGELVKHFAVIGLPELLTFIGFVGMFLFMFFNRLAMYPLIKEDDPYLKESIKHNI